jgi:hypothetical protein
LNFQDAIGLIQQGKDVTPNAIPLIQRAKAAKQRAGVVKKYSMLLFQAKLTGKGYTIRGAFFNLATNRKNTSIPNLAVIVTYNTEEQFEKIKGILASASISKN